VLQQQVVDVVRADPAVKDVTSFTGGGNTGRGFIVLKPRDERKPMSEVVAGLRKATRAVPGVSVFLSPTQNRQLGGRQSKTRYQYTLQSVRADDLDVWSNRFLERMRADPTFLDVTSDSQAGGLQASLNVDRDKANTLGVQMSDVRAALYAAFGERQVSTIYSPAASYSVIMEADPADPQNQAQNRRVEIAVYPPEAK